MELPNSYNAHLRGPGFLTTCFLGLCLRNSPHRQPLATCRHEGPRPGDPRRPGTRARSIRAIWTGPSSAITKLPRVGDGGEGQQSQLRRCFSQKHVSENGPEPTLGSQSFAQGTVRRGTRPPPATGKKRSQTRGSPGRGPRRRSCAVYTAPWRGRGRRLSASNHSRSRVAARLSHLLPHSAADGAAATEPRTRSPGTCKWLPGPVSVGGPGLVARPQCNPSAPASQR